MTAPHTGRRAVTGVDFRTRSGRAVVVCRPVDDGTTLGDALHVYADGVLSVTLPAGGYRTRKPASATTGHKETMAYTPDEHRAAAYAALHDGCATHHNYVGRGKNDAIQRKAVSG
jgi:hypothetical protein